MQKVSCSDSPKEMHQPTFVEISVEAFSGILYCGKNVFFRPPLWLFLSVMTCKMFFLTKFVRLLHRTFQFLLFRFDLHCTLMAFRFDICNLCSRPNNNNAQSWTTLLPGFCLFMFSARGWRRPLLSLKSSQAANLYLSRCHPRATRSWCRCTTFFPEHELP